MKPHTFLFFLILFINLSNYIAKKLEAEQVVGGTKVREEGKFTYQVSIHRDYRHKCGGSIIDDFFLLAAGQCFINITTGHFLRGNFTIIAAVLNLYHTKDAIKDQIIKVYIPKEFRPIHRNERRSQILHDDIAVAKLKTGLKLVLRPNLSSLGIASLITYVGQLLMITGYGAYKVTITYPLAFERGKKVAPIDGYMRFAETLILDPAICRRHYAEFSEEKQICGRMEQTSKAHANGACLGDVGSPVVYDGKVVVGIVTYIEDLCREDIRPAVYTNVSYYAQFIYNATNNVKTKQMRVARWKKPLFKSAHRLVED